MEISITQFRREIFELVNRSINGEHITIVYKGSRLQIAPENPAGSRLSRVTPLQVINPQFGELDEKAMKAGMEQAWERDWSTL